MQRPSLSFPVLELVDWATCLTIAIVFACGQAAEADRFGAVTSDATFILPILGQRLLCVFGASYMDVLIRPKSVRSLAFGVWFAFFSCASTYILEMLSGAAIQPAFDRSLQGMSASLAGATIIYWLFSVAFGRFKKP